MLNHQGKGSMFTVRREFSARKSNRLMLIVLGTLFVGHVLRPALTRRRSESRKIRSVTLPDRTGRERWHQAYPTVMSAH